MEETTTLCSNCQRPIAASNFVTHTLHCQRNLIKCDKCGEAVPRSALDEHELEFHSKVQCPDCRMSVEKPLLDTHKKTACRSRQQGCQFCELEMPASELSEHENYCGSRTKKCEDCGEYVMLKYEQLHIDSNHGFLKLDDEPGPTATWIKNNIESGNCRPAKSNNNRKPQLSTGKFDADGGDDDVDDMHSLFANLMKKKKAVGTAPLYPGVAYPIGGAPQRYVSRSPPPYQDVQDDTSDLVALPCEFCEAMIPVNQLILHQTECRMDVANFGRTKKSQNDATKKKNVTSFNEVDGGDFKDKPEKWTELWEDPKEWDGQENAGVFDVRRNAVPYVDKVNVDRHRNDIGESNIDMRRNAIDEGSDASHIRDLEDDGIYLPCEFCGDGYPPSLLLEHQDVCEYHPKNLTEAAPVWSESQDVPVGRSTDPEESMRTRKFDDSSYNTFVDLDQPYTNMTESSNDAYVLKMLESSPRECQIVCTGTKIPLAGSFVENETILPLTSNKVSDIQGLRMPQDERTDYRKVSSLSTHRKVPVNTQQESKCVLAKFPSARKKSGELSLSAFYKSTSVSKSPMSPALTQTSQNTSGILSDGKSGLASQFGSGRPSQIPDHTSTQVVTFSPQITASSPPLHLNDSDARGKSNISNSYNDLRGNFTVASEWSDDSDSRPTSATGAIPKQKAGKLNCSRKVYQKVPSSRPSHSVVSSNSRKVNDRGSTNSDHSQGFHIRNNLKDQHDKDNDE